MSADEKDDLLQALQAASDLKWTETGKVGGGARYFLWRSPFARHS